MYLESVALARTVELGGVFSCTVSRFDLGPLGPRDGALGGARNCSFPGGLSALVVTAKSGVVGVEP